MKNGDHGIDVRLLQEALIGLGVPLPRWGADGWYGDETREAADVWALHHGIKLRGSRLSPQIVEHIIQDWDGIRLGKLSSRAVNRLPVCILDTREVHGQQKALGKRAWSSITGITLHQTATCYLWSGGDGNFDQAKLDRAVERVSGIGVHGVVLRPGLAVWSHDLNQRCPQAQQAFNHSDIGIEIDGWFSGLLDDPSTLRDEAGKTFWKPASRPDRQPMAEMPQQTAAALAMCRFFIREVERHGGKIKHIHAHRQTSKTRVSDPGQMVWQTIAIPLMDEFGLDFGWEGISQADFVVPNKKHRRGILWTTKGPGRPIPRQWDPNATADY